MVKKISFCVLFLCFYSGAKCQTIDLRVFGGAGVVYLDHAKSTSTIGGLKYDNTTKMDPLIQFGILATLGSKLYFQPGVMWQSGVITNTRQETFGSKKTYEDKTKLDMILIPVKIGVRFLKYDKFTKTNVRLFGGINCQVVAGADQVKTSSLPPLTKDDFEKVSVSGDVGIGVDVFFMFIDIGYRIAFKPMYNTGDPSLPAVLYGNLGFKITF